MLLSLKHTNPIFHKEWCQNLLCRNYTLLNTNCLTFRFRLKKRLSSKNLNPNYLIMRKIALTLIFAIVICNLFSQNLKRRAMLGAAFNNLTDSIAKANKLPNSEGIYILKIVQGSTAEQLKLLVNDIVLKVNGIAIKNKMAAFDALKTMKEGDEITLDMVRKGKTKVLKGKMLGAKRDGYPDCETIYDEVPFDNGFLRSIVIKPAGTGKFPLVFFIQGYTCATIDNMGETHPYEKILTGLLQNGYAIYKVEKPGIGDCTGTPACEDIDFKTELRAYETAYNSLSKYNFIDTAAIFIFGHSMGGAVAPLMKTNIKPRGIAVYGTVTRSWFEYFVELSRVQNIIAGEDYITNDSMFTQRLRLNYDMLINKKTLPELLKNPEYSNLLKTEWGFTEPDKIFSRSFTFWQQIQDYSFINAWKNYDGKVLSIWGECDFVAFSRYDHELVADIVNRYHAGNGTFVNIPNSDHAFTKVDNMTQAVEKWTDYAYRTANFNPQIIDTLVNWMQQSIKK